MASLESPEPDERLAKALALKNDGQYDDAIAELKAILAADPKHAVAHLNLGLVYGFIGMFDESLDELQQALAYHPGYLDAHLNLGKTYCMLGMYDEAKTEFGHVLELQPDHAEAKKQLSYFESFGL